MFIQFNVVAGPSIKMFEKDALEMLRAMGLSGTVPSAIATEDIPSAIERLESNLRKQDSEGDKAKGYGDEVVDAKTRAFPLIELLKSAVKEEKSVMWDRV